MNLGTLLAVGACLETSLACLGILLAVGLSLGIHLAVGLNLGTLVGGQHESEAARWRSA